MHSKEICNKLREIRQQVADANGIHYEPVPCHFEGVCNGTCSKCEEELKYISDALEQKQEAGEEIHLISYQVIKDDEEKAVIEEGVIDIKEKTDGLSERVLEEETCFPEIMGIFEPMDERQLKEITDSNETISIEALYAATDISYSPDPYAEDTENKDAEDYYLGYDESPSKDKS